MRTFGTYLVAVILACAAGCGSGTSNKGTSSTGRSGSTGGQCPSSTGQSCTGGDAYTQCEMAACGPQYKTCFGTNFASGDFTGGACADYINCMLPCPCDGSAAQSTCETNCSAMLTSTTGTSCMSCLTTLGTCVSAAACTKPVCSTTGTTTGTATTSSSTSTLTTLNTSTLTATSTSTGTNCAGLQACCASMTGTIATACQDSIANTGGVDSKCALVVQGFQQGGYCP